MKCLIEQIMLVAPVDEDRVQRPVKIRPVGNPDFPHRQYRIENFPRAKRQSRTAQHPTEMHDVGRQPFAFKLVEDFKRAGRAGVHDRINGSRGSSLDRREIGFDLIEDRGRFAALNFLDIVLVFQQHAEAGIHRLRVEIDLVELNQRIGPIDGFGDPR